MPRASRRTGASCCACSRTCRTAASTSSFPDGQRASFGSRATRTRPTCVLNNWNVIGASLASGDIGFAEVYIAGDWATSDLARLLTFFLRNREAADRLIYGTFVGRLVHRVRHLLNRNTRAQARRNIHAHYDLGNAFYALWLDPTMSYSSALLPAHATPHAPLTERELVDGQVAKYRRVLDELQLARRPARILEIGCGWGGFAEVGARARATRSTGLTLSTEQLDYARARLAPLRRSTGTCACRTTARSTASTTPSRRSRCSRRSASPTGPRTSPP